MTTLFLISLLFLAASPAILRTRYGREWFLRPYSIFVIVACVYHGLSEIVIRATGAAQFAAYRVDQKFIDDGMFVSAIALLAMTIGYVVFCPPRPIDRSIDLDHLRRAFDWRVFGVLAIPLFISTVHGKGYANGAILTGQGVTDQGLAAQFWMPVISLTTFSFLLRHPKWWVPALVTQSVLMAAAGERLEIVVGAATVLVLAARVGMKPNKKEVATIAVIAILGMLAISASRTDQGRTVFQSNSGFGARWSALIQGIEHPTVQSVHGGNALAEASLRLDSNSWAGGIMKAFEGQSKEPIGWEGLQVSAIAAIPSYLDANKIEQLRALDYTPKNQVRHQLNVYNVDYLEGGVSEYLGNLGPLTTVAFDFAVGIVMGLLDGFVLKRSSIWRLIGYLLVVQAALFFERGIDFYLLTLRAFATFVVVAWVLAAVSRAIDPGDRWAATRSFKALAYGPNEETTGGPDVVTTARSAH